jgi:S1-C subfamily serine protease
MAFTPQGIPTQGLGFAMPAEVVRESVEQFKKFAQKQPQGVAPPTPATATSNAERLFGMQLQDLTEDLTDALGYASGSGVLVSAVEPDSPADNAGIERGLVIYRVGTYQVNSVKQVENLLGRARSKTNVDFAIGIMRTGGAAQRIESVTLTAR